MQYYIGDKKIKLDVVEKSRLEFTHNETNILEHLSTMPLSDIGTNNIPDYFDNKRRNVLTSLTLPKIKQVVQVLLENRLNNKSIVYLHEMMSESSLVLPANEVLIRNPQLEARCEILRAQQERREYQSMTKNVDSFRKHIPEDTIAHQCKYRPTTDKSAYLTKLITLLHYSKTDQ